jgi:hypothetical protein
MPFWGWVIVAIMLVLAVLGVAWWRHRLQRRRHYAELARQRQAVVREDVIRINGHADPHPHAPTFRSDLLLRVTDFVTPDTLRHLRDEALANLPRGIRSYIPVHKKGRSLPYEHIHELAPACLSFYHSRAVKDWISEVVGEKVRPALDHDQSALSILFYDQPGDHIQWHYDHNYYHGRQFTVLLSLVNKSGNGKAISASTLQRKNADGKEVNVWTEENTLIVFEGARVVHRVTPTEDGDLRVMLSMTYNTDPRIRPMMEIARRVKDIAFHGVKALWD